MKYESSEILNLHLRLRIHVKKVLEQCETAEKAAKRLGISRDTIFQYGFKIDRYGKSKKGRTVWYVKSRDTQAKQS